jgi:hypothetical protein
MVHTLVVLDHVGGNAVVRIGWAVVYDEEAHVDLRRVGIAGCRNESEASTGVGAVLLTRHKAGLVDVDFKYLS